LLGAEFIHHITGIRVPVVSVNIEQPSDAPFSCLEYEELDAQAATRTDKQQQQQQQQQQGTVQTRLQKAQ